ITCKDITINFWEDLLKEEIHRIGIGGPVAPVGDYARSLLESKKLADKIADKLIPGKDVRQVVDYVLRGEVEAALVYRTDANRFSSRGEYQIADLPIAPSDHPPIRYPVAIPESSSKQADAQKFIDFLLSEQAQTLLAEEGFIRIDS
ncbi:molybdate ABC transporter substrate-binding protein, partial [bacterium]|nr:molybdate ABC transporter substrate-binding protein [bacterium]